MSRIIVFYKNKKISEYLFTEEEFSIGRAADNQLMLDDPAVARKQAIIKLVGNSYVLTDVSGESGMTLNGEPVITEQLKNNDQLEIGPYRLLCQIEMFENILQRLSSQIDPQTGDTNAAFNEALYASRRPLRQQDDDTEEDVMEKINVISFYAGIVIAIVVAAIVIYYLISP